MSTIEMDVHLRAVANRVISAFNAGDRDEAIRTLYNVIEIFESSTTIIPGSDDIVHALAEIATTYKDYEAEIRLDAILTGMMGDGLIEHDPEARVMLDAEVAEIERIAQACLQHDDKLAVGERVSLLLNSHSWHHHEAPHLHKLLSVVQALALHGEREKIHDLISASDAQTTKLKIFDLDHLKESVHCIDYPLMVTIETYAKCNAKCTFCPYPMMEEQGLRVGDKMDEALFRKIINDLKDIPPELGFTLNLSRVNEPLLDTRLYDFLKIVDEELPGCSVWLPSNGSTLTEKNIRKLASIKCFRELGISINSNDKEEYERVMGLPFDKTIRNIDRLHDMVESGDVGFKVRLTHVTPNGDKTEAINRWIKDRWPRFMAVNYTPTDWLGMTNTPVAKKKAPVTPCSDWYQVHILADGSQTLCCFDALGQYAAGNAREQHILDIYNTPWQRKARKYLVARQSEIVPDICHGCPIR